jgi:hypothetical protein
MQPILVEAVERLTGRTVKSFISGMSTLGEDAVELFVLEPPDSSEANPAEI